MIHVLAWMNGGAIDAHTLWNVKVAALSLPGIGAFAAAASYLIDRPSSKERNR